MVKLIFLVFIVSIPLLLIGCATTAEEKEQQKNKAILESAIQASKPKPVIDKTTAINKGDK